MAMTTKVLSVSVPVADQDRALRFYTEVLGCELRTDVEMRPGARLVEVVAPGSDVALVLVAPESGFPVAVRLGTDDADAAHARLRTSDATLHEDEVLRWDGVPPMFSFADPDGNGLVYLQDQEDGDGSPKPAHDAPAAAVVDAIIGAWRTEGEVLDANGVDVVATYSGTDSYERFGPFVLHRVDVQLGGEHVKVLEMIGPWDADRQTFPTTVFDAAGGTIERSTADVDDAGAWTFRSGHGTSRGQATIGADPDGRHLRSTWQRTEDDGATWRPWMRAVHTRTPATPG